MWLGELEKPLNFVPGQEIIQYICSTGDRYFDNREQRYNHKTTHRNVGNYDCRDFDGGKYLLPLTEIGLK